MITCQNTYRQHALYGFPQSDGATNLSDGQTVFDEMNLFASEHQLGALHSHPRA